MVCSSCILSCNLQLLAADHLTGPTGTYATHAPHLFEALLVAGGLEPDLEDWFNTRHKINVEYKTNSKRNTSDKGRPRRASRNLPGAE